MEIFIRWCIAIAAQPFIFLFCAIMIKGAIYIVQEVNHTMRCFKRELRQAAWDIEWQIKLMKGR